MRIFAFSILLLFVSSLKSYSEIINKIEIKNNNRISKETIITYGQIELNKNYEQKDLNLILKNLFDTNFLKTFH